MKKTLMKGTILGIVILFVLGNFVPIISGNICDATDIVADDFDSKIEDLMEYGHFPSVVACIIKNNTIAWSEAYGYSKYYIKKEATVDTVFPIASITKSVTAVAIMQLNETGQIGLDDDVNDYLDFDLKNPNYPTIPITFRMLLAHQSSLIDTIKNFYFFSMCFLNPEFWLRFYVKNPKIWYDYTPGEDVCYATLGNIILGYILEKVTGQTYEDYCQEHIFDPLQMKNSSFYFSFFDKGELSGFHVWRNGFYIPVPHIQMKSVTFSGGGLISTLSDLSHFLLMHINGGVYDGVRILSEESVEEMHRAQYPGSYDGGFLHGFGWYSNNSIGGHGGRYHGAGAEMKMRDTDNAGVIFFWNQFSFFDWCDKNVLPEINKAIVGIEKVLFEKADEL